MPLRFFRLGLFVAVYTGLGSAEHAGLTDEPETAKRDLANRLQAVRAQTIGTDGSAGQGHYPSPPLALPAPF